VGLSRGEKPPAVFRVDAKRHVAAANFSRRAIADSLIRVVSHDKFLAVSSA
jgi:hypothetical protein